MIGKRERQVRPGQKNRKIDDAEPLELHSGIVQSLGT
jgi:hypothetical protein